MSVTACVDLFDRVEVFGNQIRRHSMLGCRSPTQRLPDWFKAKHERTMVV
jgi:hypothetical protein